MELVLSFDWVFGGVDDPDDPDETLSVGFSNATGGFFGADGQGGTLLDVLSYLGAGTFSATLDPADFTWATDWVLELQINTGGNGFGSYLLLDNVQITEREAASVDEPALLLAPGLALLALHRRRRLRAVRA
jgi:MYXO-CTERM domain-containing protein